MPILSFGQYRPDVSDYRGQHTKTVSNVVPHGDGYAPFNAFAPFTSALPAQCQGLFFARKNDGSISVFAGTATKLYNLNNATSAWVDVSKGSGTYSAVSPGANWEFRQFNNFVIAVQVNTAPQVFDITSSTNFADLGGSPPQAAYVDIVNRFLVLSGLAAPNVYRIHWSGLNALTTWTSGVTQSDYQDLADGGIVRGVAGGESGLIFQDGSIRRMVYAPGSPYIFGIERISDQDGLFGPYSLVRAGDRVFFYSPQGFKMVAPGSYPQAIGKERVDRTFAADLDTSSVNLFIGATDPTQTRVYWAYKSLSGSAKAFDKMLTYDWALDAWSALTISGEFMASMSKPGLTLEGVDAAYGADIDTLTIGTLDAISTTAMVQLAAVNSSHQAGFFAGATLEAIMETPEQGQDTIRMIVRGFRPITDAATIYGSVKYRPTGQAAVLQTTERLPGRDGISPHKVSCRYARGRVRIPAGTDWTYAAGVEPDVVREGRL